MSEISGFLLMALLTTTPDFAQAQTVSPSQDRSVICRDGSPAAELINRWFAEGKAAGNEGIYYDNRDGAHSDIPIQNYVGLERTSYSEAEQRAQLNAGLPGHIMPGITIGNCSMASGARQAGSLPRIYYTFPKGLRFLSGQYLSNNLYVFPEHQDHDPGLNGSTGFGDLYPTNTPYLVISQGASHSDRPFVHALLKTLAAFRPEVRKRLAERGMIAPTLQQILRSHYGPQGNSFDYLSGLSHPTVFDGKLLDETAMARAAQAMRIDTLPPLIHLELVREDMAFHGVDYFEPEPLRSETLNNSNAVIARIYRTHRNPRSITVSARQSIDINNRALTYRWILLRGDPQHVKITPAIDGGQAQISISYPPRRPVHADSPITSNRVDIGVFASNGHHYSAPGLITFFTLANENRCYAPDGRLLEIDYASRSHAYTLAPVSSDRWIQVLGKFRPQSSVKLSSLLSEKIAPQELAFLRSLADKSAQDSIAMMRLKAEIKAQEKSHSPPHKIAESETRSLQIRADTLSRSLAKNLDHPDRHGNTARSILRQAIESLLEDAEFFLRHQRALLLLGDQNGIDKQRTKHELLLLVSLGVLEQDEDGTSYRLAHPDGIISERDRLLLRRLTLIVASDFLFPGVIRHPEKSDFVDSRLTSTKLWRDVYLHDDAGAVTGWHRIEGGRLTRFDAEGRLISRSADQPPRVVDYRIDPDLKILVAFPVSK